MKDSSYLDLSVDEYCSVYGLFFEGMMRKPGIEVDGTIAHPLYRVYFRRIEDCVAVEELLGLSKEQANQRRHYS